MIYCISQPLETYGGIYQNYDDDMTALILISTLFPFAYEGEAPGKLMNILSPEVEEMYEATLNVKVRGKTIRELLRTLTPLEFYYEVKQHGDFSSWSLTDFLEDVEAVEGLVTARVVHWALNYREASKVKGNLITVIFGKREKPEGVTQGMLNVYNTFLKVLNKEVAV